MRHSFRKGLILAVAGILFVHGASAQDQMPQGAPQDRYESYENIPSALRSLLTREQYIEDYIQNALRVIRQHGRSKNALDAQDVENARKKALIAAQQKQIREIIIYDENVDIIVTREEVLSVLSQNIRGRTPDPHNEKRISRDTDRLMSLDTNLDGKITLQEMRTVDATKEGRSNRQSSILEELLEIDPNKDGTLSVKELEVLARKAFYTMDTDHDGVISSQELNLIRQAQINDLEIERGIPPRCALPEIKKDERLAVIAGVEGRAYSSLFIGDHEAESFSTFIDIEKGKDKLYVVVMSHEPTIWKITGQTDRISRLVVIGLVSKERKTAAGVTGLAREKIVFKGLDSCGIRNGVPGGIMTAYEAKDKTFLEAVFKKSLGRKPDYMHLGGDTVGLQLGKDTIKAQSMDRNAWLDAKAPEGFDERAWRMHLMHMPGGVVDLKKEDVVSDGLIMPYEVLPGWAGLAKLLKEGRIEPLQYSDMVVLTTPNGGQTTLQGIQKIEGLSSDTKVSHLKVPEGFRIVKDIPYYPSGLNAGKSFRFYIAKGVNAPKGPFGHSCAVDEETGQITGRKNFCR